MNSPLPKCTVYIHNKYKHESDRNKECLSVGNFGILYVVCSAPTDYTSLSRSLNVDVTTIFCVTSVMDGP